MSASPESIDELRHLVSNKVFHLLSKLLDLVLELLGANLSLVADSLELVLELLLDFLHAGDLELGLFAGDGVATLVDDVGVVGGASTVPGKDLREFVSSIL